MKVGFNTMPNIQANNINTVYPGRFIPLLIFFSLLSVGPAALLQAQISGLNNGDRVRLHVPSIQKHSIRGTVAGMSSSIVVLASKDSTHFIPYTSIEKMAISIGKERKRGQGALRGLLIGSLAGGIIGAVTYSECNPEGFLDCFMVPKSRGGAFLTGALVGSIPGLIVGAIIGSKKKDKWETLPLHISAVSTPEDGNVFSFHPTISFRLPLSKGK